MRFACNIDKTDRINRTIIGSAMCVAALIGMGKYFCVALGLALIIKVIVGWCYIPYVLSKINRCSKYDSLTLVHNVEIIN